MTIPRDMRCPEKTKIMGYRHREASHPKVMKNIFKRIKIENFPELGKEMPI